MALADGGTLPLDARCQLRGIHPDSPVVFRKAPPTSHATRRMLCRTQFAESRDSLMAGQWPKPSISHNGASWEFKSFDQVTETRPTVDIVVGCILFWTHSSSEKGNFRNMSADDRLDPNVSPHPSRESLGPTEIMTRVKPREPSSTGIACSAPRQRSIPWRRCVRIEASFARRFVAQDASGADGNPSGFGTAPRRSRS